MNKTKIEWCDMTWNPVWGCLNTCPYCYARKIANRFAWNITDKECEFLKQEMTAMEFEKMYELIKQFKPTWIESNFNKPFPKKPSRIFVNSMSDIAFWKPEWMERVIEKIKEYPQHQFLFLTKNSNIYDDYIFPSNCWLGITITSDADLHRNVSRREWSNNKRFVSIEPINSRILLVNYFLDYDWIIIGAETGTRKEKVIPEWSWIAAIVDFCGVYKIPVFLKNSLKKIWEEELIQEFPEWK